MRSKKLAALTLTFAMVLTTLAGCSQKKAQSGVLPELDGRYEVNAEVPAYQLDKTEDNKLTWYVNADWWNTDWGNDTVTKKVKEDLNLDIEFLTGDDTKLNTYFAGEELPDIITIFSSSSSIATSANQWAYSLNELADKYDPYFYKVAKEDTLNWFKLSDGKTYGYPGYSNSQEDYDDGSLNASTAFVIRKDIYEALGKPSMGTPEEFLDVLSRIKEQFPDVIPFGSNAMTTDEGSLGRDLQNFLGVPLENEDGSFYDRQMDDDYLTWIKTLNQAYRNGCISDDNFSDDGTAHEEKVKIGKYGCIFIGGTPQRSGPLQTWYGTNPEAAYIAIDGPRSIKGNAPTLAQAGLSGWPVTYISKNCSDPIKAIELFTYLLTDEAGILTTYGVEGETYEFNSDGKIVLLPEVEEMRNTENDKFKKVYRLGEFCLFGHDRYKAYGADVTPAMEQLNEWGEGKLKTQFVIENINPEEGTAEARSLSAINTKWATTLVSLIRSQDDAQFDAVLEEYKAFREQNNWNEIVKIYNEKMDINREKLGYK